ncbi:similar to Saccharomyces cerevisiae YDL053C PBP4 Pbp1p binding protein, interacts strongly with Pab1p-binding protein 1 (Pbp1p) in the yeast two-hybrid system [Maudiozyma barnettii]|uniref:Similar to Saccharomyces cerevisiae YDL053C PBP4 Pbp1p binding protein, interacts strongly with Pab1p-binding protein 1 (Pbp1p) in the yeast two-hybrid system n=1 Tax=Maudiozyma barnettii TaxID=61262 RepID=A0A8H2VC82_9SACH|nr:Pbp4p [Kazachstania barnettii]CAB4252601.1 similar to Saccharomyces cerevisiae YDL053C PBP4 Pbp1p binding protein, interacts strongly with Pab1p-binding protein 1 (Pbp1p) in the yeast two-hybrid system [Kazachstania barnettii]CAD1779338.1 similar to Saccharomyces cerevisiae YDL053C PBP4 Pbp1p binding protein, interacts strongly with Pab1p-binding protein 1 (Pbp1p) in the yeast two-hybrid system [Kazachstania barnettii]
MNRNPKPPSKSGALSPSVSTKPKLTSWAQAATKAAPNRITTQTKSPHLQLSTSIDVLKEGPSNGPATQMKKSNRKPNKVHYNRTEVQTFMNNLYQNYLQDSSLTIYDDLENSSNNVSSWDSYSSTKSRNKKYGCLAEVAAALKNIK